MEQPSYLHSLLHKVTQSRSLRSNKGLKLSVPRVKTNNYGDTGFQLMYTCPMELSPPVPAFCDIGSDFSEAPQDTLVQHSISSIAVDISRFP